MECLSDMYGKCGSIEEARQDFDKMVDRDDVSWTAVIDRYLGGLDYGRGIFFVLDVDEIGD